MWTDAGGTKHVFGLVSITIPSSGSAKDGTTEVVRISSVGVSMISGELETGFAIGYQSYGSVHIGNNSCVDPQAAFARMDGNIP